jgi:hypothetical protein
MGKRMTTAVLVKGKIYRSRQVTPGGRTAVDLEILQMQVATGGTQPRLVTTHRSRLVALTREGRFHRQLTQWEDFLTPGGWEPQSR